MSRLTIPELQVIRRGLKAKLRPSEIARKLGLAVATVLYVATDRKLRRRKLALLQEQDLPEDDQPPEYVAGNLRRCDDCGGTVYQWPCLACRIRAAQERGEMLSDKEEIDDEDEDEDEVQNDGETEGRSDGEMPSRLQIANCELQICNSHFAICNSPVSERPITQ